MEREGLGAVLALERDAGRRDVDAAIARLRRDVEKTELVSFPDTRGEPRIERAGDTRVVLVPLRLKGERNESADAVVDLRQDLNEGSSRNVEIQLVGQQALWAGMQDVTKADLEEAEFTGFPIVLLILLAVFGSLAAAALPLALGFAAVMITGAMIFFLSQATEMSIFVTNVASMIGIGVAVDYSLFVLARYREEIHRGASTEDARRIAMRTSGIAVAFSRRDRDGLPRRAVPGRLADVAVDGDGRDHRGGGLDPRGDHAAARADAHARQAGLRARAHRHDHRPARARAAQRQAAAAAARIRTGPASGSAGPRPSRAARA